MKWSDPERRPSPITLPRVLSAEEARCVEEHEAAVQRLHPELKRAYDLWQALGHAGSLYDYLPGNYRSLWK